MVCARHAGRNCHFIEPPYCERLGIPFVYDPGPGLLSMEAIANPPAYDRARAAVRYDDVARALVHRLKYGDRLDLAPMMGRWMARAGRELLRRGRRARAGAAALAPAVGAPVQPVGGARARGFRAAACRCCSRALQARQRDAAAGRPRQDRARRQCAGRVPGAAERQGGCRGPSADPGRRRADLRRDGRACARALLGPVPPMSMCWFSPGLWRRRAPPYKCFQELRDRNAAGRNLHHPLSAPIAMPAKALLKRKGVEFTEIDVGRRFGARERDGRAGAGPHTPCRRSSSARRMSAAATNSRARTRRQARPAAGRRRASAA